MAHRAHQLQQNTIRLVRVQLFYTLVFVASIIVLDAWNVVTQETILERWFIAVIMAVVTAGIWYASRQKSNQAWYYQLLISGFIVLNTMVATYSVYAQRGIASRSVFLYVIPIAMSVMLLSRAAIFATTTVAAALYALVCVNYFYLNPGQAYKAELYGELGFYIGLMYVVAALLWAISYSVERAKR